MKISRTKKTKAYIPKTEEEKEQVRIKEFLDMCAPSVLKFYPDYISAAAVSEAHGWCVNTQQIQKNKHCSGIWVTVPALH